MGTLLLQRRKIGYTQLLSLRNFHSLRDYWWFSDVSYIFLSHLTALKMFLTFLLNQIMMSIVHFTLHLDHASCALASCVFASFGQISVLNVGG